MSTESLSTNESVQPPDAGVPNIKDTRPQNVYEDEQPLRNVKIAHQDQPSQKPVLHCDVTGCTAAFIGTLRKIRLDLHKSAVHQVRRRIHACESCGNMYLRRDYLLNHQRRSHPHLFLPLRPEPYSKRMTFSLATPQQDPILVKTKIAGTQDHRFPTHM